MFCTKCGKENSADSSFCGYCGNPFQKAISECIEMQLEKNDSNIENDVPRCPYCHSSALSAIGKRDATAAKLGGHHPLGAFGSSFNKLGNSIDIMESHKSKVLCLNCGKEFIAGQKSLADIERDNKKQQKLYMSVFGVVFGIVFVPFVIILFIIIAIFS